MHRLLSIIILFFGLQTSLLIKARLLRETLYIEKNDAETFFTLTVKFHTLIGS